MTFKEVYYSPKNCFFPKPILKTDDGTGSIYVCIPWGEPDIVGRLFEFFLNPAPMDEEAATQFFDPKKFSEDPNAVLASALEKANTFVFSEINTQAFEQTFDFAALRKVGPLLSVAQVGGLQIYQESENRLLPLCVGPQTPWWEDSAAPLPAGGLGLESSVDLRKSQARWGRSNRLFVSTTFLPDQSGSLEDLRNRTISRDQKRPFWLAEILWE